MITYRLKATLPFQLSSHKIQPQLRVLHSSHCEQAVGMLILYTHRIADTCSAHLQTPRPSPKENSYVYSMHCTNTFLFLPQFYP